MQNFKCAKCGSYDIIIRESMFTTLYICKKCGHEWRP